MAKVSAPLHSQDASGKVGKDIIFRHDGKGVHVYKLKNISQMNKGAPTPAQSEVRNRYRDALQAWRNLTPTEKQAWNKAGEAMMEKVSGWNLFVSAWWRATQVPPIGAIWNDGAAIWDDDIPLIWDL